METLMVLCSCLILMIVAILAGFVYWMRKGEIKGIPEPPGNYAFGHVFQLGDNFCKTFLKWKKVVGPVFQLRLFGVRAVVFNDKESIAKVCGLPEASGRPHVVFFSLGIEIAGEGVAGSEGAIWEEQRQLLVKALKTFRVGRAETERSLQDEVAGVLKEWEELKGAPFKLRGCCTTFVFNALWNVIASRRMDHSAISELSDHIEMIAKLDTLGHKFSAISTKLTEKFSNAVEEKIQGFKALAKVARESVLEHQKDRVPNAPRDYIDQMLDKMDATNDWDSPYHEKNLKTGFALGDIILATLDTTSRTLEWLMFHLARNPEVAAKLHAEIDRVFGDDLESWPTLSDQDAMPYAQACILEALRIGSVVPFGVPHKALEDFEFDGAVIPKGTVLVMNQYGVHFDPEVWESPEEFKPERFLTPEGDKIDLGVKNKIVAFGAGRRICPGSFLAMDSMFLYVVNVYRKFRFEIVDPVVDSEGRFGFIRYPPSGVELRAISRVND